VTAKSAKVPIAAIVGGVLGGVILILLTIIFLWHRRRNQLRESVDDESESAYHPRAETQSRSAIYPFNPSMEDVSVHHLTRPASQSLRPGSGDPFTISPYVHPNTSNVRSSLTDLKKSRMDLGSREPSAHHFNRPVSQTFRPASEYPDMISPFTHPGAHFVPTVAKRSRIDSASHDGSSLHPRTQSGGSESSQRLAAVSRPSGSSFEVLPAEETQNPPAYDAISLYLAHDSRRTP
jgi:hypothetical protein